ncbi:MAG: hypothetical protein ACJ783_07555, partial [Myxococcales bacterium]
GVSDRIRVTSIVDRFLEHTRIWHFEAGGKREMFLASADWMQRNFVRRVEIAFPVDDPAIRDRIFDEILTISLADNVKARILRADGTYERAPVAPGAPTVRSQERFMAFARRASSAAAAPVAAADVVPNQRRPERRRKKRTLA